MYLAHLPAGYLLSKFLQHKLKNKRFLWAGLLGSVAPDFDLAYNFFDPTGINHRYYPTHTPLFWIGTFGLGLAVFYILKILKKISLEQQKDYSFGWFLFTINAILHLLLDLPTAYYYPQVSSSDYFVLQIISFKNL